MLWRVHELDPEHMIGAGTLDRVKHQSALRAWLESHTGLVAELALDELADIETLTVRINQMQARIGTRVQQEAPND